MARLSRFLPPFAGDYSGACSVLFGLDCLVVIVDAGCCTRNYVEYDEARWACCRRATFSAQLRTLDAVLGDDAKIVGQAVEAAGQLQPACVAVVGTPVPAIVGMDMAGIAAEIEATCGIPTLGFPTNGFNTYEQGVSLALDALCRRFAGTSRPLSAEAGAGAPVQAAPPAVREGFLPSDGQEDFDGCLAAGARQGDGQVLSQSDCRLRVNLLGLTPHDFQSGEAMGAVEQLFRNAGADPVFSTAGAYGLDDVAAAAGADASIVVSWSGLAAARTLEQRCGVPFLAGCPANAAEVTQLIDEVRQRTLRPLWDAGRSAAGAAAQGEGLAAAGDELPGAVDAAGLMSGRPILIVGEQVAACSLRARLRAAAARGGAQDAATRSAATRSTATRSAATRSTAACSTAARSVAGGGRDGDGGIRVASFFAMEPSWMEPGDLALGGEADLVRFAQEHPLFAWVGDPLLRRIPGFGEVPALELPHEAVSGTLYA